MGFFKKLKKVVKATSGIGLANKARKKGNKLTRRALKRSKGPRLKATSGGNARRAINKGMRYRKR
jgi:hypothetical protein